MKKEEEIKEIQNVLYLFLHSRIYYKLGEHTNSKTALTYMFEWRIPKKLRPLILKEMIILRLVEKKDKDTLIIKKPQFDEENCNSYYIKLGLF
ncbi:MAG TPA: hypothetical protein ENG87_01810 [Candidatus Pacearchaeota archaeon]|nr:hypothetical protein BMS3Abin17_00119 [archaeon BMS3Abin17]HDK42088.1 hypothetical protein [Candidatus Pacearchaeota archaeon]HDZ60140.1 hypothetical protein [Candidatus Pacearchaeota archaeon]